MSQEFKKISSWNRHEVEVVCGKIMEGAGTWGEGGRRYGWIIGLNCDQLLWVKREQREELVD